MHDVVSTKNKLLSALPAKAFSELAPKFEHFELNFGESIYDRGQTFTHVYFVESGIISLVAAAEEGLTIEVGMVGNEGMAALPVFLGIAVSQNRAVVQGAGTALRMSAADFIAECRSNDELSRIMRLFTYQLIMQIARSAVCNRSHSTDSRLARWLLMTMDRMRSANFRITQEFLSYMVGVRREAVNKIASGFQRSELISYNRGRMTINDRKGLEAIACTCYATLKRNLSVVPV